MIPPAVSDAEWVAAYEREPHASLGFHPVHLELVQAADFGRYHQAVAFANAALPDEHAGKLTWAMVDLLTRRSGDSVFDAEVGALRAIRDAIAALLPPRETPEARA